MLVGEAPGSHELARGKPFVGPSGWRLEEWWQAVGLQRSDFYVTNVVQRGVPGNKIEAVPKAELSEWQERLHERLAALQDPWVLVPTGNVALQALTGHRNILKHRGSIYAYHDHHGRAIKVIPTVHPAATFRTPGWERRCRHDWARIAADATFRDLRLPVREHFIRPTLADVDAYVHDVSRDGGPIAVDIETPGRDGVVTCIGFAQRANFSITIPTTLAYWGTPETVDEVWRLIRTLCASPLEKILQNGLFDAFNLLDMGVVLRHWRWDTLALSHCRDATDSHALAYQASVHTREPYWKDDYKDDPEAGLFRGTIEDYWRYNGKDACVTRELLDVHVVALEAEGRLPFYDKHYRAMFQPLLALMRHGLAVDGEARAKLFQQLLDECASLRDEMNALAGTPLTRTTKLSKKEREAGKQPGLSAAKLKAYLYQTLKLPRQINRGTGKETVDETALQKLMLRHGEPIPEAPEALLGALAGVDLTRGQRLMAIGQRVLTHREKTKTAEFLDAKQLDADGRLRCSFKFTTDTGRLASGPSPRGTGRNMQNIMRAVRRVFVPDPGCLFVEVDESQGEDRIVKMLMAPHARGVRQEELLWRARAHPTENDEHRRAAAAIFGVAVSAVTRSQRDLGKRSRHAGNYDMGAQTFADNVLKETGRALTRAEAQQMLDAIKRTDPELLLWQADVRQRILTNRCLVTTWGRPLAFDYVRLDADAYRQGYAFEPQSTLVDIVNQYGLVPFHEWRVRERVRARAHLQGHDSLLLSVPPDEVWRVLTFLWRSLERPRFYRGQPLTIPVTAKIGCDWSFDEARGAGVEFKTRPSRDEIEEVLRRWPM